METFRTYGFWKVADSTFAPTKEEGMTKNCTLFFIASMMLPTVALVSASAQQRPISSRRPAAPDSNSLRITFAVPKKPYKVGETISLTIQFYNQSQDSILLTKQIPGVNIEGAPVLVDVSVINASGRQSSVAVETGHSATALGLSDITAMLDWWVLLEPRQFYGTTVNIDQSGFDSLKRPGRYKLRVKLTSYGGYPPSIANRLAEQEPKVPKVPYSVWSGSASWESPWFQITQ